jgi:cytochrome c oxidase subunit III
MATIVHEPPRIESPRRTERPSSGNGGWRARPPVTGGLRSVEDSSPASRTGVWVGLAAITMTFAAFTSAMIVRQGGSNDWQHFTLPSMLYMSTAVLLVSSAVLEVARKRVAVYVKGGPTSHSNASSWLWLTMGLGWLFVACQYLAWLRLRAQGMYLATNPSSSFFYLFTGLHAVHVIGGLAGLALVICRFRKPLSTLRISTLSTVSYYWHFMAVLWIYLLLLLWMRV